MQFLVILWGNDLLRFRWDEYSREIFKSHVIPAITKEELERIEKYEPVKLANGMQCILTNSTARIWIKGRSQEKNMSEENIKGDPLPEREVRAEVRMDINNQPTLYVTIPCDSRNQEIRNSVTTTLKNMLNTYGRYQEADNVWATIRHTGHEMDPQSVNVPVPPPPSAAK